MFTPYNSVSRCEECGTIGLDEVQPATLEGRRQNLCRQCNNQRAFQRGGAA